MACIPRHTCCTERYNQIRKAVSATPAPPLLRPWAGRSAGLRTAGGNWDIDLRLGPLDQTDLRRPPRPLSTIPPRWRIMT